MGIFNNFPTTKHPTSLSNLLSETLDVLPQGGDQYLVANRVEELNIGVWVKQKNIAPLKLRSLVEQIIKDEKIRSNIDLLSDSLITSGGTQKAVDKILEFKQRNSISHVLK